MAFVTRADNLVHNPIFMGPRQFGFWDRTIQFPGRPARLPGNDECDSEYDLRCLYQWMVSCVGLTCCNHDEVLFDTTFNVLAYAQIDRETGEPVDVKLFNSLAEKGDDVSDNDILSSSTGTVEERLAFPQSWTDPVVYLKKSTVVQCSGGLNPVEEDVGSLPPIVLLCGSDPRGLGFQAHVVLFSSVPWSRAQSLLHCK